MEHKKLQSYKEVAELLKSCDNVSILTHENPDGDCLGSGIALCLYLRSLGKKANVLNSDGFPAKFDFVIGDYEPQEFEEEYVISVDISDTTLLGKNLQEYTAADKIDLCIDHHGSNRFFAKNTYVDPQSSAACLIIFELLEYMGADITLHMATALYTGLATDTGCFKFQNTTPEAHRAAAKLMELGVDIEFVDKRMFDTKSRARLLAEQKLISEMRFLEDGQIAVMVVTNETVKETNLERSELDSIVQIPITVEGVRFGYTLKQLEDDPNTFKVSLRTTDADAAAICESFGGGGHLRAAGCTLTGSAEEVLAQVCERTKEFMRV